MDEQAELRFKSCMDVKKKFNLKIAFAQKSGSLEDVKELQTQLQVELKKVE